MTATRHHNHKKPRQHPIQAMCCLLPVLLSILLPEASHVLALDTDVHIQTTHLSPYNVSSASTSPSPPPPPPPNPYKIAAFASRLEEWFLCRRHQLLLDATESVADGQRWPQPTCGPHFDGHLCWPNANAGHTIQVSCPKLRWSQQGQSAAKAVMNGADGHSGVSPISEPTWTTSTEEELQKAINQMSGHQQVEANATRSCSRSGWQAESNYEPCQQGPAASQPFDPTDKWIKLDQDPEDRRLFERLVDELERLEGTIDPYGDPDFLEQWILCIGNIMHHEQSQSKRIAHQERPDSNELWCPIIFDGWRCWPATRASDTAYAQCPSSQPGFSAKRMAHKICTSNGTWYRHPLNNRYWSNYTTCVDFADWAFRKKINQLNVIGNLISLLALIASLVVFVSFKSLRCTRVTIHKNLFLSFIANNLMWIIWYTRVVNDADVLQTNPIKCRLWHIVLHYFLVSNYFWMFCEGLYLHTLLVVAFVSENKILKWFYLLGWLTPLPITITYAWRRWHDKLHTNYCWMDESPHNVLLSAPIGISLLLNLVFLINIVRVLVTKLRANNSPDTHQTRKAVRATLILIPLLGLHYMLTPFRPEDSSEWEYLYEIVAATCTSLQGLCVALLFCFFNGEVINVLKKKLKDTFNLHLPPPSKSQMRPRSNTGASLVACNFHQSSSTNNTGDPAPPAYKSATSAGSMGQVTVVQETASKPRNFSNSSSLLTTVTASPI